MKPKYECIQRLPINLFGAIFIICFIFTPVFVYSQKIKALDVEASVPPIQKLLVKKVKIFPNMIDAQDMDRGYVELSDCVTLTASSNVSWRIVILTNSANMYVTPGKFKSIDNFQWRIDAKPFLPISLKPTVVTTGNGGVKDGLIELDYRLKVGWHDTPAGRWQFQPEFRIEPNYEGSGN